MEKKIMTYGRQLAGVSFNPSNNKEVDTCKESIADLIDQMNDVRIKSTSQEQRRLASIAITELQGAKHWAVAAITWEDSPLSFQKIQE